MGKKDKQKLKKKRLSTDSRRPKRALRDAGVVTAATAVSGLHVDDIRNEIDMMTDTLHGRIEPPVDHGTLTLMEVADAYYARSMEWTMQIHRLEADGLVKKGDALYILRTGELRDFSEMCKRAADLGSRRLTQESLIWEKSRTGRESMGGM